MKHMLSSYKYEMNRQDALHVLLETNLDILKIRYLNSSLGPYIDVNHH